jgi:hypothetical protein
VPPDAFGYAGFRCCTSHAYELDSDRAAKRLANYVAVLVMSATGAARAAVHSIPAATQSLGAARRGRQKSGALQRTATQSRARQNRGSAAG